MGRRTPDRNGRQRPPGSAPLIRTGTSRLQRPVCCRYTRADRPCPVGRGIGVPVCPLRAVVVHGGGSICPYAAVAYGGVTRPPGPRGPHRPLRTTMTPPAGAAAVPVHLDPARTPDSAPATERKRRGENVALVLVIAVPFLALVAAVPV